MGTCAYRIVTTVSELEELSRVFEKAFGETCPSDNESVQAIRTNPGILPIGAFEGEILVGGLIAYEMRLLSGARELYVYDIGVLPSHQGRGIGTGLMHALKVEAKTRGITTLFVDAEADDDGAVAFYRSLGAKETPVSHFTLHVV